VDRGAQRQWFLGIVTALFSVRSLGIGLARPPHQQAQARLRGAAARHPHHDRELAAVRPHPAARHRAARRGGARADGLEFERVLAETRLGMSLLDSLDALAARLEIRDLEYVVHAVRIQQPDRRQARRPAVHAGRLHAGPRGGPPRGARADRGGPAVRGAGVSGRFTAEEYIAGQVVGVAVGTVLGLVIGFLTEWSGARITAVTVGAATLGFFIPALYVKQNRDLRVEAIERELPDVLDVLAISVEAGVGLEGAIQAVVDRFSSPLGDELGHMLSEMELGLSRREALQSLRARTDIPDLNGFVLALLQADALGMPMTRVLQTQAEEMRRRRRAKVREAAAKLPVKIIIPLVLFIFPALFIAILGPAVITISENLFR
jgi:tight adherence protein C